MAKAAQRKAKPVSVPAPAPAPQGTGDWNGQLSVVYRPPESIRAASRNARTHSDAQIAQLEASIAQFGFTNPVLLDEDQVLIAGHGRLAAARKLCLEQVPTITIHGLTASQKRALALADNRLALSAGWDDEVLRFELGELQALGEVDIGVLGFSQKELARILDPIAADTSAQLDAGFAYRLIVDCTSEAQQRELLARFEAEGLVCRPLIS